MSKYLDAVVASWNSAFGIYHTHSFKMLDLKIEFKESPGVPNICVTMPDETRQRLELTNMIDGETASNAIVKATNE